MVLVSVSALLPTAVLTGWFARRGRQRSATSQPFFVSGRIIVFAR